jgi:hypothetical protein
MEKMIQESIASTPQIQTLSNQVNAPLTNHGELSEDTKSMA